LLAKHPVCVGPLMQVHVRASQGTCLWLFLRVVGGLPGAILLLYPGAFQSKLRAVDCARLPVASQEVAGVFVLESKTSAYVANSTWLRGGLRRGLLVCDALGY
jgi:hypothetical protein